MLLQRVGFVLVVSCVVIAFGATVIGDDPEKPIDRWLTGTFRMEDRTVIVFREPAIVVDISELAQLSDETSYSAGVCYLTRRGKGSDSLTVGDSFRLDYVYRVGNSRYTINKDKSFSIRYPDGVFAFGKEEFKIDDLKGKIVQMQRDGTPVIDSERQAEVYVEEAKRRWDR